MLLLLVVFDMDRPVIGSASFATFAAVFGFFYAVIVQALRRVLTRIGVLTRAPQRGSSPPRVQFDIGPLLGRTSEIDRMLGAF